MKKLEKKEKNDEIISAENAEITNENDNELIKAENSIAESPPTTGEEVSAKPSGTLDSKSALKIGKKRLY